MDFKNLGLSAELLRAIEEQGYSTPTPVQQQAIPLVLEGHDVLAGAQTGTGKTAGFMLPLMQRLAAAPAPGNKRSIRALVLTPTRELAAQVGESAEQYGKYLPLRSAVVFGGVKIGRQIETLRRGVDILVATPGRLLDHVGQRTVDLSQLEIFVLDEADRMLDMGFIHDIRKVLALIPPIEQRQSLLFSATFPKEIKQLASSLLNSPRQFQVASDKPAAERIEQQIYSMPKGLKRKVLSRLISAGDWHQVLVFTRTKHGANRLAKQLDQDGFNTAAIHGNKSQAARTRALAGFKDGNVQVLVATDIAARGIDIDQLPYVVNYELPNVPEDYVHRIGRTARAGRSGLAVSLVSPDEDKLLRDIERVLKNKVPRCEIDGMRELIAEHETMLRERPPQPESTGARPQGRKPGQRSGQGQPARADGRKRNSSRRRRPRSGEQRVAG